MLFSTLFYVLGLGSFFYAAHLAGLSALIYFDLPTLLGVIGVLGLTLLMFPTRVLADTFLCRSNGEAQQARLSKSVLRSLRRSQSYGVALALALGLIQFLQAAAQDEKVMASLGTFLAIGLLSSIYWLLMQLLVYQPLESFWDRQLTD